MQFKTVQIEGLKEAMAAVEDFAKRQVPYAASVMLNRTAEDVLAGARQQIQSRMTVRSPGFILPPVQLPAKQRATRQRLFVEVSLGYIDGNKHDIGKRREKILRKFESGGTKSAQDPQFPIAIPTTAIRRSFGDLVPSSLYPTNLRLAPMKIGAGEIIPGLRRGKVRALDGTLIGKRARRQRGLEGIGGTFTINDASGNPIGVFQRIARGEGKESRRMLWVYKQRIRIPDLLDFFALADEVMRERAMVNWEGALALALRTAR